MSLYLASSSDKPSGEAAVPGEPSPSGGENATTPSMHPGTRLAEELQARGLSAHAFALKLRVPANRISEIIRGRRAISAETALRISRCLGGDPAFWLRLQAHHDLARAEHDLSARIASEVEPI